jgi:3',5'-cyclic AMP phosphodiesterase CpdA
VPTKIIHLSDLHLGDDIVWRSVARRRYWGKRVSKYITDGLAAALHNIAPDYVIISGDFVNKPDAKMFDLACSYVQNLFLQSGISLKDRLLVVPGNHDVSFFPKKHADDFRRLHLYRQFLMKLFKEDEIESRRQRFFRVDPRSEIIFACLDSTLRDSFPLAEGQVGASQLRWVSTKLDRIRDELGDRYSRFVKIAVVHHHVVAIAGGGQLSDRFMQLLDAGDLLKLLNDRGFNVVVHGHRHHPHVWADIRSDSSVFTVVGAGTATCCFEEEQHGFGNNFNLLTLSPERNVLAVQRYRADGKGEFCPEGAEQRFPLLRKVFQGYRVALMRKVVTVSPNGKKDVSVVKEGLRVLDDGRTISALPLRVLTDVAGSKIVNFDYDRTSIDVRYRVNTPQVIDGDFVPRNPLTVNSNALSFHYRYTVEDGTAMSQADMARLYPGNAAQGESSAIAISHPMDSLKLEVAFPPRFETTPSVAVEHMGTSVPLTALNIRASHHDKVLNIYKLEIHDPPVDHLVTVKWNLPAVWP